MNKLIIAVLSTSALVCGLVACSDDPVVTPVDSGAQDTSKPDTGTPDAGGDAGNTPAPPKLGTQIDRMGRPAINTALNNTFNGAGDGGVAAAAKDEYNANGAPATWTKYTPEMKGNLAIFDGVDTNCGTQLAAAAPDAGPAARYATLGTVFADDRVWLNSTQTTCNAYLAVELAFITKTAIPDCGGRTMKYDVIDTTYSALAIGATTGVDDGVVAVPAKVNGTTFPYLIPAQ